MDRQCLNLSFAVLLMTGASLDAGLRLLPWTATVRPYRVDGTDRFQ
ncbi:hypothetical protein [Variovorax sp. MHTC-1]|nr:hypothetical protein [Variovorax sp. MHTC-1]